MFVVDGDESVRLMMSCSQFGPFKSFWEHHFMWYMCTTMARPWAGEVWAKCAKDGIPQKGGVIL